VATPSWTREVLGRRWPPRAPGWFPTTGTLKEMPANNPRLNVVLERPLYDALLRLARQDGVSLSEKARDLLRNALEVHENVVLNEIGAERERTINRTATLTHDAVWRRRLRRK